MESDTNLPNHVAIIMDGNGRWAKKNGFKRLEGHRRGVQTVRTILEYCGGRGIRHLTLFAFSSENWRRPPNEVRLLMRLLATTLDREIRELDEKGVRISFIGDLATLPVEVQEKIATACEVTKENTRVHLTLAINYGGKWDLRQACTRIAAQVASGQLTLDNIDELTIHQHLATASLPDPDLFIRTGGEQRMSNFLLWQLAYTELYFTDVFWPEFDIEDFERALRSFSTRVRRFGRTDDQVRRQKAEHA